MKMSLNEEDSTVFKSVRPKLITKADPMGLLPFLTEVFVEADMTFIQHKVRYKVLRVTF